MASLIDPTKPVYGNPTTLSVRDNFAAAKSEIEALQTAIAAAPGDITSVSAGTGLTGGGTSGDVLMALATPVSVANGGTGAGTAAAAVASLGAVPLAGGVSITGGLNIATTSGNVGIGMTPVQKLDVNGTINGTAVTVAGVGVPTQSGPTAWTPTDASGAGLTLTVATARYLRTGKQYVVWADITYPTTGNTNTVIIGSLPALPSSLYTNGTVLGKIFNASGTNDWFLGSYTAGPYLLLFSSTNVGLTNANVSGQALRFQIVYSTD